jgi:WD40 repeat protein
VVAWAEEPATKAPAVPAVARPAEALAGELVRVRPQKDRKDNQDLLNQIDTAKDVVYAVPVDPVPEAEQFQFVDGALRTPAAGDARLCLPIELPKFYHLTLTLNSTAPEENRPIGIGLPLEGRQCFVQSSAQEYALDSFLGRSISGNRMILPNHIVGFFKTGPQGGTELWVGDIGFVVQYQGRYFEWFGTPGELSLDPKWATPHSDKLFLAAPAGQFDIVSIKLDPLTREAWLQEVSALLPSGRIAWADYMTKKEKIGPTVDPLPPFDSLRARFRLLGYRGDFDELEEWAERFRKQEVVIGSRFALETFYEWLAQLYLVSNRGGVKSPPDLWEMQFAFNDAWLKHKPDSVAAHIVKARTLITYAWAARGSGVAKTVGPAAAGMFQQRIEEAHEVLNRAARLSTGDAGVFSALLTVGMAQGWDRGRMELTLERGLQITKKDNQLYAAMVNYLLPRWHGKTGDIGKLAEWMSTRVKGDDGLDVYARIALSSHDMGVGLSEFSADKLKAAVPIWIKRYPDHAHMMNYACWLCCKFEDRESAKTLFDKIALVPDVDIWNGREKFDVWHHWSDPSVPLVSQYLPAEPEQVANLQAYTGDLVHLAFMPDNQTLVTGSVLSRTEFKFWNLKQPGPVKASWMPTRDWTVEQFRFLPDGKLLASMTDGEKKFLIEKQPPEYELVYGPLNHRGVDVSLASDDWNTGVMIEDGQATADHTRELKRNKFAVPALSTTAITPDGNYLLGVDAKIHLWNTHTGEEVGTIDVQPLKVVCLEDSSGIAYTTDSRLVVWDIAGKTERFSAPLERCTVRAIASSRDGRLLATADLRTDAEDGQRHVVSLWDLKSLQPIHTFAAHQQPLGAVVFSHDAKMLASSSLDGIVKVWKVDEAVPPVAAATPDVPDKPAAGTDDPAAENASEVPAK